MAVVDRAGVDPRGNILYQRKPDGDELIIADWPGRLTSRPLGWRSFFPTTNMPCAVTLVDDSCSISRVSAFVNLCGPPMHRLQCASHLATESTAAADRELRAITLSASRK